MSLTLFGTQQQDAQAIMSDDQLTIGSIGDKTVLGANNAKILELENIAGTLTATAAGDLNVIGDVKIGIITWYGTAQNPDGSTVTAPAYWVGTDGAFYFKSTGGTVTQVAPN